jgi:outer membrane protein TolC
VEASEANLQMTVADLGDVMVYLLAETALNRIALLLGQRPGELHAMLGSPSPFPVPSTDLAVGVPADTLRNRPGMTATADMTVKTIDQALLIPNAALRFAPPATATE